MKKVMKLQTKITLLVITVVFLSICIIISFVASWLTKNIENKAETNIMNVAEMIAHSATIVDALENKDPNKKIAPYVNIRPGFFMQNVSGIHSIEIREQDKIFVPAGKSKTSFIDASDIGVSVATLLHKPEKYRNSAHTITGPQALDYYQVAEILSNITGRKITYDKPGYLKYRNYYIKKRGLDKEYVNVTVALYFMTRMGTAKEVTDEFYNLTEKKPRTFEDFARENIEAFIK